MLNHDTPGNERVDLSTLSEIMHLVDMESGVTSDGWSPESARLFAIDTAMTALRRNMTALPEAEKQRLVLRLQEARTLVVSGRDSELGFIQTSLEAHLSLATNNRHRRLSLMAIDALIPSPYRAALVTTKSALSLGTTESLADLSNLLRDRLLARLGEGSLLSGRSDDLTLTA